MWYDPAALFLGQRPVVGAWLVCLALAAASLNLIMGYGGMMSFGHAAYLGIGGYAVGILAQEGIGSGFIQWPVALAASATADRLVRIPIRPEARSLNLANAVAIGLFEAVRQLDA